MVELSCVCCFDNYVRCEDEGVEDCGFLAFGVWRVKPGRKRVLQFPSKQTILFFLDQRVASLTERADLFWSILTKSFVGRKNERGSLFVRFRTIRNSLYASSTLNSYVCGLPNSISHLLFAAAASHCLCFGDGQTRPYCLNTFSAQIFSSSFASHSKRSKRGFAGKSV